MRAFLSGRRAARVLVALAGLLVLALWAWDLRHYVLLRNFRTVEAGRIYAGAYQQAFPLRRLLRDYRIKTVVSLRSPGDPASDQEVQWARQAGAEVLFFPIDSRDDVAGRLAEARLAAEAVADPARQPVYVHCWAGKHRASAVVGWYRHLYCGWSAEAIAREAARSGAFTDGNRLVAALLNELESPGRSSRAAVQVRR